MQVRTEKIVVESDGHVDLSNATTFILPKIATASLPAYGGVKGMLVYNSTTKKLNIATNSKWSAITSSA